MGVGTTTPSRPLEISGSGDQYARITSTSDNIAGLELYRPGNGFTSWRMFDLTGNLHLGWSTTGLSGGVSDNFVITPNGNNGATTDLGINLGSGNPLATFDVRANGGTDAIASISGKTSFASLVVDNSGVGDLFTASSSGLSRFVITQGGNVGYWDNVPKESGAISYCYKISTAE